MRILKENRFAEGQVECEVISGILFVLLTFLAIWLGSIIRWASFLFFTGAILLFYFGLSSFNRSIKWKKGIKGKRKVANALTWLDASYFLINGALLPSHKGGQIDHVLVGPTGIFAIKTKNYGGSLRCYGEDWYKRGYIKEYHIESISNQAKLSANYVEDSIKDVHAEDYPNKKVKPVLVFTNPNVKLDLHKPTVSVVTVERLCDFVKNNRPEIFLPPEVLNHILDSLLHYSSLVKGGYIFCWKPDDIP